MENKIFEDVDKYIENLLIPQDEALLRAESSLVEENLPLISVSPNQGKLLQVLALTCNAKRILEIGTLAGYSTIWLARALPEDGKLISIEFDPYHAEIARKNVTRAGLDSKVQIITGKAMEILEHLIKEKTEPFDMIFIDADKPPYTEYFQMAIKLSRPGTLIIADNVIRNGDILNENSTDEKVMGVQRFNKFLSECKEVNSTIIQTVGVKEYDGMAIAVVK